VSTKPAPNPNVDARARKIAVPMGAVPHKSPDCDRRSLAVRSRTMRK
jgi:hypothetical protein